MIPISDVASQLLAEQERADGCVEGGGGGGGKEKRGGKWISALVVCAYEIWIFDHSTATISLEKLHWLEIR